MLGILALAADQVGGILGNGVTTTTVFFFFSPYSLEWMLQNAVCPHLQGHTSNHLVRCLALIVPESLLQLGNAVLAASTAAATSSVSASRQLARLFPGERSRGPQMAAEMERAHVKTGECCF
jgi:hypothetical protein